MKKKEQIRELNHAFNDAVRRNFELLNENARLRDTLEKRDAFISELGKENAKLELENDVARAQLLDLQDKTRSPVVVQIK